MDGALLENRKLRLAIHRFKRAERSAARFRIQPLLAQPIEQGQEALRWCEEEDPDFAVAFAVHILVQSQLHRMRKHLAAGIQIPAAPVVDTPPPVARPRERQASRTSSASRRGPPASDPDSEPPLDLSPGVAAMRETARCADMTFLGDIVEAELARIARPA